MSLIPLESLTHGPFIDLRVERVEKTLIYKSYKMLTQVKIPNAI